MPFSFLLPSSYGYVMVSFYPTMKRVLMIFKKLEKRFTDIENICCF